MATDLPIYLINRAEDEDRLAGFAASAEAVGANYTRIEALDGHDPDAPLFLYRTLLRDHFRGEAEIKPGALACAVSHMTAWRRLIADGAEAALICEDDARLTGDGSALAAAARRYESADLVFANSRMSAWRAAASAKSDGTLLEASKLLTRMARSGAHPGSGGLSRAPGADAYLISRRGAERMLALISQTGIVTGVDWLMLAAGGVEAMPDDWEDAGWLKPVMPTEARFGVYIASDPVADQADAPSVLRHSETISLVDLRDAPSLNHPGRADAPEDLRPDPVSDAFRGGRFYEEPALAMMARWMPRGGVFADIGAHVGNHTLFMLRHGGAGTAIPFEHNRFAIEAFTGLMERNDLSDRVVADHLGYGLAEEAGKREARGAKRNPFVTRLKAGFDEPVRVRPGDALLRETDVDMIKIDVNGEEREVIKGLRKTLKRKSPLLVVEMTRPRSAKASALIERLGYREAERAEWDQGELRKTIVLFHREARESAPKTPPADGG